MAMEKPAYRDNLELILKFLHDKYGNHGVMLNNKDVQEFTGRKYEYVKRNYMGDKRYISAAVLAREIS